MFNFRQLCRSYTRYYPSLVSNLKLSDITYKYSKFHTNCTRYKFNLRYFSVSHHLLCESVTPDASVSSSPDRVYKKDILESLKSVQTEDTIKHVLLLKCCGDVIIDRPPEERTRLLHLVWKSMKDSGVDMSVEHHNALLQCYVENRHAINYRDFLKNMACPPNADTFQLLLQCVCENGDMVQAMSIIEDMKERNVPVNEISFNSLITGYSRAGNMENVQEILNMMRATHVDPSALTYVALLKGYAEAGDRKQFLNTFENLKIDLSLNGLLDVTRSMCETGHENMISLIEHKMLSITTKDFPMKIKHLAARLVHSARPEAAYHVYKTFIDHRLEPGVDEDAFCADLIKEMVLAETSVDVLIKIADDLVTSGKNVFAFHRAVRSAHETVKVDTAISLLNAMHERRFELRVHYFWPVLLSQVKTGEQRIFDILKWMSELNVKADYDTLLTYVLPFIGTEDAELLVRRLQKYGLTVTEIVTPLCVVLLNRGLTGEVVKLCDRHKVTLNGACMIKPLVEAYNAPGQAVTVGKILKAMCVHKTSGSQDLVGLFAYKVIRKRGDPKFLLELLKNIKYNELNMTFPFADSIEAVVNKRNYSPEFVSTIKKLIDDVLRLGDINVESYIPHPKDMSLEDLECHLVELRNKNMETRGVLRKLLQGHCRLGNYDRAVALLAEFNENGFEITAGMKASLLDLYMKNERCDQAVDMHKNLAQNNPEFTVDEYKIIDLAALLIQNDRFDDVIDLLKSESSKRKIRQSREFERNCWKLLNVAASTKNVSITKGVFNCLIKYDYCVVSNVILGPLIRVHMNRNDLKSAVEEYENFSSAYKNTPLQHELLCNLLSDSDTTNPALIERVLNASRKVHPVENVRISFMSALAENGLHTSLRKLLAEHRSSLNVWFFKNQCNRWAEENKIVPLKAFLVSARGLNVNIEPVYTNIIRLFEINNDCDGLLEFWYELQICDDPFVMEVESLLVDMFERSGRPLPEDIKRKYCEE